MHLKVVKFNNNNQLISKLLTSNTRNKKLLKKHKVLKKNCSLFAYKCMDAILLPQGSRMQNLQSERSF